MKTSDLISSFSVFKDDKKIDREIMMHILEEVFRTSLVKRDDGKTGDNYDIIVNIDKGDLEIFRNRVIVEDGAVKDPKREIAYSDAIKIEADFEVGEELSEPIPMSEFGRREILSIRQNLVSKVQEYEKSLIYQKYKEKVGEVVTCEVYQSWNKEVIARDEDGIELILPKSEQIMAKGKSKGDHYRKGDTLRAVVLKVEMIKNNPVITLSRTSPIFLERLLTNEIPEIYEGLISIKKIVREPGDRAKVAVESYDDRIDPVGSCVGQKGSRIRGIATELREENIDVIHYSPRLDVLIQRALSPAKITSVRINEELKKAVVYMEQDQVSKAIGANGSNIKLANKLVGYNIEVYRSSSGGYVDDVDINEFDDEIERWVIDQLISIGCDTACSVLALSREQLIDRADLEEETVDEVIRILKAEIDTPADGDNY